MQHSQQTQKNSKDMQAKHNAVNKTQNMRTTCNNGIRISFKAIKNNFKLRYTHVYCAM